MIPQSVIGFEDCYKRRRELEFLPHLTLDFPFEYTSNHILWKSLTKYFKRLWTLQNSFLCCFSVMILQLCVSMAPALAQASDTSLYSSATEDIGKWRKCQMVLVSIPMPAILNEIRSNIDLPHWVSFLVWECAFLAIKIDGIGQHIFDLDIPIWKLSEKCQNGWKGVGSGIYNYANSILWLGWQKGNHRTKCVTMSIVAMLA